MVKYYTMKECFDACGDNDVPFNEETTFNCNKMFTKRSLLKNNETIGVDSGLSDKWQIKRAEKKVLSAEEIAVKVLASHGVYDEPCLTEIEFCCEGIKNGQLKEWNRLVAHIKEYKTRSDILENLKPPYEQENE